MPTLLQVCVAAPSAALFFSVLGWPLARLLLPPGVAEGAAPALGWAVYCAVALPVFSMSGFSAVSVAVFSGLWAAASLGFWRRGWASGRSAPVLKNTRRPAPGGASGSARGILAQPRRMPRWEWRAWLLAGAVAVLPAFAIMPKYADGGVLLAPPMFDHVKVAMIDAMVRQGLPPANPFFGGAGSHALAYYYLWHFSAAVLAKLLAVSGWAADVAMTWFTAFASLTLMMGLAVYAGGRRAPLLVALLCIPASLRPVAGWIFGRASVQAALPPGGDIGAWVNQASWVPQHMASACCVVLSALLIAGLADGGWLSVPVLGLVVASGFESSTWVGGVAFAVAAAAVTPALLRALPRDARRRFVLRAAAAAAIACILVTPFLITQAHSVAARGVGFPVTLQPYRALAHAGGFADLVIFWVLVLPFNFPALYPVGALGVWRTLRAKQGGGHLLPVLAAFAGACLSVTWLLRSTIDNNDLGWRAAIPAVLLLTVFASAAWARWLAGPWRWPAAAALLLAALGLVQSGQKLVEAVDGQRPADAAGFARSVPLWAAVRAHTAPDARVANNPLMLATMTPWPDDISWALLSNRPSCYAGWATGIAYAGVTRETLLGIDALFKRVFAGEALAGDAEALALRYGCAAAVLTPADGAWLHDPFAASPLWRLVEAKPGAWRIYAHM
jgi:hypothetical protein